MVPADAEKQSTVPVTLGDFFVLCAILIVGAAFYTGSIAQLGLASEAAIVISCLVCALFLAGHVALRRAHSRSIPGVYDDADDDMAEPVQAPVNFRHPRDRRPDARAARIAGALEDEDAPVDLDALEAAESNAALEDMDLGRYRPKDVPNLPAGATGRTAKAEAADIGPGEVDIDSIIRRLAADIMAGRKTAGMDLKPSQAAAPKSPPMPPPLPQMASPRTPLPLPAAASTQPPQPPPLPAAEATAADKLAAIADALVGEHMDVCLETISGLDDERAKHYEVSVRLRLADGSVLHNDEYTDVTRGTGILPLMEAVKVSSTKRIALQMIRRGRSGSFFSTIDGEALSSSQFNDDVETITSDDPTVATRLVLAFSQADVRDFNDAQWRVLDDMAALGFRFSIGDITDLDMDFEYLTERGFAFAKLDAALFRIGLPLGETVIPASDICRHLALSGLALIIGGIDDERARAEILGFGALLGQGALFGGPRPVKAELVRQSPSAPPQPALHN